MTDYDFTEDKTTYPAVLFVKGEIADNQKTNYDKEYIRRDVVGRAMWRLMADWKHFIGADTIDKYINDAIADDERSEDK